MRSTLQYCHEHKVMESYPSCDNGYPAGIRNSKNTQLPPKERPILWTKKDSNGQLQIRYPGRNDGDMPSYYKSEGYEKKEFNSYQEHQKFCKENELVNHAAEGIK